MAKAKVRGFTIQIIGEQKKDGYSLCDECGGKTMLVYPYDEWRVDDEPYKNGETVELDSEIADGIEVSEVTGHYCKHCNILTSITYNFP